MEGILISILGFSLAVVSFLIYKLSEVLDDQDRRITEIYLMMKRLTKVIKDKQDEQKNVD